MILSPESIEENIGLSRIRARLRGHVLGERGALMVDDLAPVSERAKVEHRLGIAAELHTCLVSGDPIPFEPGQQIASALEKAKPHGAALATDLILDVHRLARTARLIRSFFSSRSEVYPTVHAVWSGLRENRDLEKAIEAVFEPDGKMKDSASPELRKIRRELHGLRQTLRARISSILAKVSTDGHAADDQPTIRSGRMVIPVIASAKRKVPGFVHDVSSTGQTVFVEPSACLELNNHVRELEIGESREIEKIRRLLTDDIRACTDDLNVNDDLLAELDVALAIAKLARELDAIVPPFNNEGIVRIVGGRNPELLLVYRDQGRAEAVVPLNIEIGDSFQTLLISGPNAGGKSVAMKTVGLMVAMLGMGIPIPVSEQSTFHLFDRIMVDIGDAQSVEDDLSTYSSHLRNLGFMLRHADAQTLVLIDEAGTGTDPDEGSALARAILEQLTDRQARTIATTHHGGLKAFAHDAEGVANGSMSFDTSTLKPAYEFRLHTPGASYATEIATKVGLPANVISRARALLGSEKARMESLILSLEESNRLLDEKLSETTSTLEKAHSERDRLTKRLVALQAERDAIQEEALNQAEEILKQANRTVEKVISDIRESQADADRTKVARKRLEEERAHVAAQVSRLRKRTAARRTKAAASPAREVAAKEGSKEGQAAGPLRVGDHVRVEDADATGQILSIKGSEAMVRLGDLQTRVKLNRLTKVGGAAVQKVTIRHAERAGHELASFRLERRLDVRGCRVDEAIPLVVNLVDEAVAANLDRVEILHGKGTGALRQAIQEYLMASGMVSRVEEAPWDEGGAGVTVVWLDA